MAYASAPKTSEDFEAQYDCDTLQRAADIMKDPGRIDRARSYAKAKAAKLEELVGDHKDGAEGSLMKGYRSVS